MRIDLELLVAFLCYLNGNKPVLIRTSTSGSPAIFIADPVREVDCLIYNLNTNKFSCTESNWKANIHTLLTNNDTFREFRTKHEHLLEKQIKLILSEPTEKEKKIVLPPFNNILLLEYKNGEIK